MIEEKVRKPMDRTVERAWSKGMLKFNWHRINRIKYSIV
jgi:hypothetical protein